MAIPTYEECMLPLMKIAEDDKEQRMIKSIYSEKLLTH